MNHVKKIPITDLLLAFVGSIVCSGLVYFKYDQFNSVYCHLPTFFDFMDGASKSWMVHQGLTIAT